MVILWLLSQLCFNPCWKAKLTVLSAGCSGLAKTLSAAAMIAGLLVMDPSLKIMIVTKENVAAHAFARHFLRLELPDSINCLVGRLVGYVEMQKGPANRTVLDIPPAFRNDVLRSKQLPLGWKMPMWLLTTRGSNMGTSMRPSAAARAPRKCLDDVSDTLVVKQTRAEMFDLTPV